MKICELKIKKKYYEMIQNGTKKYEVRKTNKGYIQSKDLIRFIDIDTKEELGICTIIFKSKVSPRWIIKTPYVDDKTKKFVEENYAKETFLVIFNIKPVEVIKT